ncbi:MAG: hypothetical protein ACLPUG_13970 [Acidimicrobiales bacterium]
MSEQYAFIEDAEQDAIDNLVATTRQLVEAVLVVELRLAAVAALTEKFGTRYAERATIELQGASDRLKVIEERRRAALTVATSLLGNPSVATIDELVDVSPGPIRQLLADSRADLIAARDRIDVLRNKAEDILGRRIALVVEALTSPGGALEATYGREHRPRSRVVSGVL